MWGRSSEGTKTRDFKGTDLDSPGTESGCSVEYVKYLHMITPDPSLPEEDEDEEDE